MDHSIAAAKFIQDSERVDWHNQALWHVRQKRDALAHDIPDWEQIRQLAEQIKAHTLEHLGEYLELFEKNAKANGSLVHWAESAEDHNRIVADILREQGAKLLVKSKSMLTEECGLNPYLENHGFEVIDTDLGERIVQLKGEPPSHIVLPAIHLKKEEVGDLFHQTIGTEAGLSDPKKLTEAARQHLREKFLKADAGLTGVNFGIAETGGFVVCTNEGNADLGSSLPPVHIASMGIEKLIPRVADLGVFTRLLARSATGQHVTTYTSHYHGPVEGKTQHIIIVDNGRSDLLANPDHIKALTCIRCGACLNTCPVFRVSGGHSYGYIIPGPIGSVLALDKLGKEGRSLPFACTLCASCRDICPAKVDLDTQLYRRRQEVVERRYTSREKRMIVKLIKTFVSSPSRLNRLGKLYRLLIPLVPRFLVYSPLNTWGKQREIPKPNQPSFRDWYKARRRL